MTQDEMAAAARHRWVVQQIGRVDGPLQREFLLLVHASNDETTAAEEIVGRYGTAAKEEPTADF